MFVVSNDRSLPVKESRQFLMLISKVSRQPPIASWTPDNCAPSVCHPKLPNCWFFLRERRMLQEMCRGRTYPVTAVLVKKPIALYTFFPAPFFFAFFQTGADDVFPSSSSLLSCSLHSLSIVMSRNTRLPIFVQVSPPRTSRFFFRF